MYPTDLKYTREHEWVRVEGKKGRVGITGYAVSQLGDVVFVELPKGGKGLRQMEPFGVVESVKAVSDLYSPVSGRVLEVNSTLESQPEQVNSDPYGSGWMIVVEMADLTELTNLLSAAEYEKYVKTGGGH